MLYPRIGQETIVEEEKPSAINPSILYNINHFSLWILHVLFIPIIHFSRYDQELVQHSNTSKRGITHFRARKYHSETIAPKTQPR